MNDKIRELLENAEKTDSLAKLKWRIENREQLRKDRKEKLKELMEKDKQQTALKLYTEEQLVNTAEAIRNYLKNYPEKFHESMIEKHLKNLTPIELPSDEEIKKMMELDGMEFDEFDPYDVSYLGGACWMRNKIQGGNK
jgi:histidinol phosphatase-like enzyme